MVTLNAAAFLASIWDPGGISAGSGSWGCTYDGWLILWGHGPCRCTTAIKQKSNQAIRFSVSESPSVKPSAGGIFPPFEAFIKSTPSRPILEPLPQPIFTIASKSTCSSTRALEICAACWKWTLSGGNTAASLRDQTSKLMLSSKQILLAGARLLPRCPEGALKDTLMLSNWKEQVCGWDDGTYHLLFREPKDSPPF